MSIPDKKKLRIDSTLVQKKEPRRDIRPLLRDELNLDDEDIPLEVRTKDPEISSKNAAGKGTLSRERPLLVEILQRYFQ